VIADDFFLSAKSYSNGYLARLCAIYYAINNFSEVGLKFVTGCDLAIEKS
jgi:hypothetical protein